MHLLWLTTAFGVATTLAQGVANCPGYAASNIRKSNTSITADLTLGGNECNAYGDDIHNLKLLVEYQTGNRLHVKIYDRDERVYQIPEDVFAMPKLEELSGPGDMEFAMEENPFSFSVRRASSGQTLFNTSGQALVFQSQYLRLRTSLPNDPTIYGLGENADPFRHNPDNYSHPDWNSGEAFMPPSSNLYGSYPVYYDHRGSDGTHAVYLHNSNGKKINMGVDSEHFLEYNTIGGVLDFYFISGSNPKEVSSHFADLIGYPTLMPYWGFGFHQCKYGYQDTLETAAVVANYSAANIPLETIWNDIDYMDYRSTFSLDPLRFPLSKMREFINYLHDHGQHYIVMVDPAVASRDYPPFHDGVSKDAFMKEDNGTLYTGVVWPGPTNFPDWLSPNAQDFWNQQFDTFFNADTGVDIDGLWIDMNEASNFCDYPCPDPKKYAIENRSPPRPPPARMSSPYQILGFPDSFQPQCMATVTFNVGASVPDGNDLLLFGDAVSIGNGTPFYAPNMQGSNDGWTLTAQFPAETSVSYSYPLYTHEGLYIFEAQNRTLNTGECGSMTTVSDQWSVPNTSAVEVPNVFYSHSQVPQTSGNLNTSNSGGSMQGLPGRNLISPPYNIGAYQGPLSSQTLPTNLHHANGLTEYDVHNLYSSLMGKHSRNSMIMRRPGKRPLIITRSSYIGDSVRLGHWFGDNRSVDSDYRLQIIQMIQFVAMFQMPMVGSDVCGFNYDTNPTLCARWAVLGAWNPFYRNHAEFSAISQEFYRWPIVADAARKAIATRYRLLDYMYTNFHRQSTTGTPMLTPLVWQYPDDPNTFAIDLQFFHGDALLVSPVTTPNDTSVTFYMPNDLFYDFDTYEKIQGTGSNMTRNDVGYSDIPVFIHGGSIIPLRINSANTTTELRQENFELIIGPSSNGSASGELYLDDGESLEPADISMLNFTYGNGSLEMDGTIGYDPGVKLSSIKLLDVQSSECPGYDSDTKTLTKSVDLLFTQTFTIDLTQC